MPPDRSFDANTDGAVTDTDGTPDAATESSTTQSQPTVPPGPDGYPIVGNSLQIAREPIAFLEDLRRYGDVVRYRVAGNTATALLHPDDVERVLVEDPDRFERYLFADRGFDFAPEGLLFTHGEQWRTQRQLMQSAFTMDRIRSYAETMSGVAAATADRWADGDEIVLNDACSRLTLELLTKTLFDIEIDPAGDDEAITRAAQIINEQANSRTVASFVPEWVPTPSNRRYRRAMADYRDRVTALIDRRREGGADADDLLSILLCAEGPDGETLSEAEIRDNLLTFTFAGHETTSLALTYTILLLSQHREVRERLDTELDRVLDGSRPTVADVPRLEYTDRIVTEALRLYPPAFIMSRTPIEDTVIGGYEVPADSIVTLPIYLLHRDDRFYDDPDAFRPDRWSDEFEAALPDYAYFPFGGGPRHCIGMRFAMLELKLVLATLVQRFEFELLSDPVPELDPGVTLQPAADVRVRLTDRS